MTVWDFISKPIAWLFDPVNSNTLAGLAGAAAVGAADWSTPWKFIRHLFVGLLAAGYATDFFFPLISKALTIAAVPSTSQGYIGGFVVGGFAIYLFQFSIVAFRDFFGRSKEGKKP